MHLNKNQTPRSLTSLTSKALWCCYPDAIPIFDSYARRALWVLSRLMGWLGLGTPRNTVGSCRCGFLFIVASRARLMIRVLVIIATRSECLTEYFGSSADRITEMAGGDRRLPGKASSNVSGTAHSSAIRNLTSHFRIEPEPACEC